MSSTAMSHTPSVAVLTRDEAGRVALRQPFPAAGPLFGLLFMLPGLKLLWDFVGALIEVGAASAWHWTDVFGFGLWLVFALVFLVPGWIIATLRRSVAIDRAQRLILQINDFLLYRWTSTRSLGEFQAVRLYFSRRTSSSSAKASHHVELAGAKGKNVIVYLDRDEDAARAIAREVAAFTALPLQDDVNRQDDSEDDD
jgi:hypothetical protein